ncbi:5-methylribose kinase [Acetoanaerobium sticklandii]|uniref:S-methyl-5-thioribose kinase n=1 Tax=Acetoanaerobium sticklandii (strain ATCC 12662 / DSM 519 / JCM 1433 / CCUG 9281 / NCIMB 10654 / HF) TaxID=499177 RepID=E3PWJ9_ACESD|nr:S-methyl-5-thioribose kinase [Acetoanaerobium sticklandii]CBH20814.1 5-methylribose kinase [Acetoanaerobium sticklandii]
MNFDKYFTMSEADAALYAKTKLDFFGKDEELVCKEIGDGNLNYIFKIDSLSTSKSLIIKQSGPVARISDEFKLSADRNRIEYEILKYQSTLAPGLVPEVYSYDPIMNCTSMEDLSDHVIMRTEMINHKQFKKFADDITTFMVNTLLLTSDVCMEHKAKKELVKNFINPELCEISEDLVYTEPFSDINNRNDIFAPNVDWVKENIYSDEALKLETAKLKFDFMNNAQALVHGDLHTGSIFIKEDSTKVIDPEFAFYGPMGYDVGNVIANLMFALANAQAYEKAEQIKWLEDTIVEVIDLFKEKFSKAWDEKASEYTAKYKGFKEYYLDTVLRDTAAVTGLEGIRRIVGIAHVKDITSIQDEEKRTKAERLCMLASKSFIMNREELKTGKDFLEVIKKTTVKL